MKKRFIEWDLPLAEISEESAREKSIRHGHPSTLHIWWARRPLASSRATNFAALIDLPEDPEKREEIRELIKRITPWEAVKNGNSEDILKAREMILEQYGGPPKVLDPFAGGGSIPLEALRLGCETYASDYNPVAVLIEKATLEWPQKYGIEIEIPMEEAFERELKHAGYTKAQIRDIKNGFHESLREEKTVKVNLLAHLVEKYANKVLEEAKAEIGQFYPEQTAEGLVGAREITHKDGWIPVGYLWARTIPCQNPKCHAEIPLIKQFWLAKKRRKSGDILIAFKPVVDREQEKVDFEILIGEDLKKTMEAGFNPKEGTVKRANAECLICGQITKAKKVRKLGRDGKMGERMVVVVLHHPDETGKKYSLANEENMRTYIESEKYLQEKIKKGQWMEYPLPDENLPPLGTLGFRVQRYGITKWKDLFNARQKLALITFIENIKNLYTEVRNDLSDHQKHPFLKAVATYLSAMVSRVADFSSKICVLNPTGGRGVVHTFGRHAIPMAWDYTESNIFNPQGASWYAAIDRTLKVIEKLTFQTPTESSTKQTSATNLPYRDGIFDAISTDPPYYDNVPYSDLSDFFYIWLKRCGGDILPDLFSTPLTPKSEEVIAEPVRHSNSVEFFETMLSRSFDEIYRVLKQNGVATIVYAHKTTEGWETLLNSLAFDPIAPGPPI